MISWQSVSSHVDSWGALRQTWPVPKPGSFRKTPGANPIDVSHNTPNTTTSSIQPAFSCSSEHFLLSLGRKSIHDHGGLWTLQLAEHQHGRQSLVGAPWSPFSPLQTCCHEENAANMYANFSQRQQCHLRTTDIATAVGRSVWQPKQAYDYHTRDWRTLRRIDNNTFNPAAKWRPF